MGELDIKFKTRMTVKGQIIADFLVHFTPEHESRKAPRVESFVPDVLVLELHVNGAFNIQGSEVGLILTSPKGMNVEYALRFEFPTSSTKQNIKHW